MSLISFFHTRAIWETQFYIAYCFSFNLFFFFFVLKKILLKIVCAIKIDGDVFQIFHGYSEGICRVLNYMHMHKYKHVLDQLLKLCYFDV